MTLDEFKAVLENDATKRADAQEQTIRELHKEIRRLKRSPAISGKDLTFYLVCLVAGFAFGWVMRLIA